MVVFYLLVKFKLSLFFRQRKRFRTGIKKRINSHYFFASKRVASCVRCGTQDFLRAAFSTHTSNVENVPIPTIFIFYHNRTRRVVSTLPLTRFFLIIFRPKNNSLTKPSSFTSQLHHTTSPWLAPSKPPANPPEARPPASR